MLGTDRSGQSIVGKPQFFDATVRIRGNTVPFREGLVGQPVRVVRPVRAAGRVVGRHQWRPVRLGGWGTMERKRTLRGSGREFDTICLEGGSKGSAG